MFTWQNSLKFEYFAQQIVGQLDFMTSAPGAFWVIDVSTLVRLWCKLIHSHSGESGYCTCSFIHQLMDEKIIYGLCGHSVRAKAFCTIPLNEDPGHSHAF